MASKEIWHLAVTVGTSAIVNQEIGYGHGHQTEQKRLQAAVQLYEGSKDKTVRGNQRLFNDLLEEHRWFWKQPPEYRADPRKAKQTSAELISTAQIIERLNPVDVLLIASDNDEGEFAAELNKAKLEALFPKLDIQSKRLKGLDLGFEGVVDNLRQLIVGRWPDDGENVAFNVTGGYKGTVLFVTALALGNGWDIYYRHETLNQTMLMDLKNARIAVTGLT